MARAKKTKVRGKVRAKGKGGGGSAAKAKPRRAAAATKPVAARPDALARERARLERNKRLVLAFYAKMIGEKDPEGARAFMGERYVQHSPYATDGFEGVAEFARTFKRDFPKHRYEVKKVIAEGDFVVLHLHGIDGPSPHGEAVCDFFRVKGGKVVEHWDVIQPLPAECRNPNGPF